MLKECRLDKAMGIVLPVWKAPSHLCCLQWVCWWACWS